MKKTDYVTYTIIIGLLLPFVPFTTKEECIVENNQTLISLTIDDGYVSWIKYVDPVLEKYNLSITAFICDIENAVMTKDLTSLTWDMVQQLNQTNRWEFSWHTLDHHSLVKINDAEKERQISGGFKVFIEHGLPKPETFCYPYGAYDYMTMNIASKYFVASRTTWEGTNTVCWVKGRPMEILVWRFMNGEGWKENRTNDFYKQIIEANIDKGTFIVFYFHSVEEPVPSRPVEITADDFDEFMEWLSIQDIKVLKFSEAVEEMKNRVSYKITNIVLVNPVGAFLSLGIPIPNRYLQVMIMIVSFIGSFNPTIADLIVPYMVPIVTIVFIGCFSFLIARVILLTRKKEELNI